MKKNIRLIALDLDGTLLNSDKQLPERNRAALYAAAERGIEIVPTTGRYFGGMPAAVRELPFLHYAITINGAQALDVRTGEVFYRAEIPLPLALELMDTLETLPVIYDCYQDNRGWITGAKQERADEYTTNPHYRVMLHQLRTPVPELRAFLKERGRPVQKVQFFTLDGAVRQEVLETFDARFPGIRTTTSVDQNVEFNAADGNKGKALAALAARLGIPMEQVAAFGDGLNDISMLEAAGTGVAMANGCPEALAAADLIAPPCDECGVAAVLEELPAEESSNINIINQHKNNK